MPLKGSVGMRYVPVDRKPLPVDLSESESPEAAREQASSSAVPFAVSADEDELEVIDPDNDPHLHALLDEGCTNTLHFQRWETYAAPIMEQKGQQICRTKFRAFRT